MANKSLFKSIAGRMLGKADTRNNAGGPAYKMEPKHLLAQYAATGCMSATFYASADEQLEKVLEVCREIEPEFIARTAIYARQRAFMKDLPALLCAVLAVRSPGLLAEVFDRVIDDARMLRNFVQIVRSGVAGRKSLGSLPKRMVQQWLEKRTDEQVFRASVGTSPSIADVIRMVHPRPASASRSALYGYLLGRAHDEAQLPGLVRQYEEMKAGRTNVVPEVPFQMLTSLPLGTPEWADIAWNASWQMTRMNLNTFARHGVFNNPLATKAIAARLRDGEQIARAKVFPYQLMVAYKNADASIPEEVREALQDAMELSLANVPVIDGQVYVCPDVSGSMSSPATGYRKGATSAVRCIDVAALVAAAVLRRNPTARVLPFEQVVKAVALNPRDSVMTNAAKLASIGGGGTNCSAPLAQLNAEKAVGDLVIFVSDNESWADAKSGRGTATMQEWNAFVKRNRSARMVCIDIQPNATTQAVDRADVLNVGGFSDPVFTLMAEFAAGRMKAGHWVGVIEAVSL